MPSISIPRLPRLLAAATSLAIALVACSDAPAPPTSPTPPTLPTPIATPVATASPPAAVPPRHAEASASTELPGNFDYWLIALSWSPTYCEANPDNRDQCGSKGFGFVLHGLWPQYQRGGGPQDCPTRQRVDERTIDRSMAFMPSRGLIIHQWRSHGSCTRLDADDYFRLADRAYASVRVPDALRAPRQPPRLSARAVQDAFVQANPDLDHDAIRVVCKGGRLSEVRVCVDGNLDGRRCGNDVRNRCPAGDLRIPVVR